ncbi:MAG: hypothetical protein GC192_10045 [Bacteroidetes bacterium]|nr:hypothetical protein [Bacteroidota bacterium]
MTKKLPLIITASAVSLALVAVILYQGGYISDLKQTIQNKDKKILAVNLQLEEQVGISAELEAKLQVYKDSVNLLLLENKDLHAKIETLKGTISKLNQVIQKHDDKVNELTSEIKKLRESGQNNANRIKDLEQQRDNLLKKMEAIDHERIALMEARKKNEIDEQTNNAKIETIENSARVEMDKVDPAPLMPAPPAINQSPAESNTPNLSGPNVSEEMQAAIISRQQERLSNIMTKTQVKFESISLRNREGGNELKNIKKNDNDWRYTFIDFDLDNIDREAIMDEYFVLQVFDLDNNEVMPFNEKNMAFPKSEMGAMGYKFKYDGKPVSIRYINTQAKEGSNYEVRLLFFKKDLAYELANGKKRIVESGKVTVD